VNNSPLVWVGREIPYQGALGCVSAQLVEVFLHVFHRKGFPAFPVSWNQNEHSR
jgi:hypothetical protein